MNELEQLFLEQVRAEVSGSTLTYPSRWAKNKRMIPNPVTQVLEPFSTKYHPWMNGMLDSKASFNYVMKGTQLGISELALLITLFTLDVKRTNALYVLPTTLIAGNFSKGRINPAVRQSPELRNLFVNDVDSVLLKQAANGANLYITGAKGDANLREKPTSVLVLDEVDVMNEKQVGEALERLSGHIHKMVWGLSTPGVPSIGIHKLFLTGTQEYFHFKCPLCRKLTMLVYPDCLEICGDSIFDPRIEESHLKCKECKGKLEHEDKPNWLSNSIWVPNNPDATEDRRSFHISQLYSFTVKPSLIAAKWFDAQSSDIAEQQLWNDKLGLPFVGEGSQATDEMIQFAVEKGDHSIKDNRPTTPGEMVTTLGVDTGKTCWYVVARWFVDHWTNDINAQAILKVIDFGKFSQDDYWRLDELMEEWQIHHCVIDPDPNVNDARRFAKRYNKGPQPFVHLCRYRRGLVAREISITDENSGAPFAIVDRTNWVSAAMRRFPQNRIILPRDTTTEFRSHMKAPVRTYRTDLETGDQRAEWVKVGPDHWAHALTLAEIGLPFAAMKRGNQPLMSFL